MALSNCPRCGRLFDNTFKDICQQCARDEDKLYEKVRDYIKENRSCTIYEASEATEVSVKMITRFIKQGRIDIRNNPNMLYPCETCGEPIATGRFCNQCVEELHKGFSDALKRPSRSNANEEKRGGGYHIDELKKKY